MQFINVDFRPENSENITDYDAPKEHKNGIPLFLDSYLSFITTGLGWVHEAFAVRVSGSHTKLMQFKHCT